MRREMLCLLWRLSGLLLITDKPLMHWETIHFDARGKSSSIGVLNSVSYLNFNIMVLRKFRVNLGNMYLDKFSIDSDIEVCDILNWYLC